MHNFWDDPINAPAKNIVTAEFQRARGDVRLSTKSLGARTVIDGLRQAGSLKVLFPRQTGDAMTGVLVNTAGGVTGGDRFCLSVTAQDQSEVTLTTQAAERAYRAMPLQSGYITTHLNVASGARMNWLPQETILFEGANLDRKITVSLADKARFLFCEPLVFGRAAMGEHVHSARLEDRVDLRRDGSPLYYDKLRLQGDVFEHLARRNIAAGAGAMVTVLFVSPDAETQLDPVRALLPDTGGASLLRPDLLVVRALATDSFALRQTLIPILTRLSGTALPRPWMI